LPDFEEFRLFRGESGVFGPKSFPNRYKFTPQSLLPSPPTRYMDPG